MDFGKDDVHISGASYTALARHLRHALHTSQPNIRSVSWLFLQHLNHTRSSSWPWVSHLAAALAASLAAFEADDSVDTIEDAMISQSSSAKVRNLAQVKSALRLPRYDWVVC